MAIVDRNPLRAVMADPARLIVAVLFDPADGAKLRSLARQDWKRERLAIGQRVAYLWCPDGITGGRLAKAVGCALEDSVTMRNWATLTKLHALAVQ